MPRSRSESQESRRFVDPFALEARRVDYAAADRLDLASIATDASQLSEAPPPPSRYELRHRKTAALKGAHRMRARALLEQLPEPACSVFMLTSGTFDFFDFITITLQLKAPAVCERFTGSTWVLNRANAQDLLRFFDAGLVRQIGLITGTYFKQRESAVFHLIYQGLKSRGQRFKAAKNHSKWVAMRFDDGTAYAFLTSANFTENGNAEQCSVTHDPGLVAYLEEWADRLFEDRR